MTGLKAGHQGGEDEIPKVVGYPTTLSRKSVDESGGHPGISHDRRIGGARHMAIRAIAEDVYN